MRIAKHLVWLAVWSALALLPPTPSAAQPAAVSYQGQLGNLITLPETRSQTIDIDGIEPDLYTFTVVQVNALGTASNATSLTQEIYGKTAPPADITGFTVTKVNGVAQVQWVAVPDLDVQIGGNVVIRHSMATSGATWNDSVVLDAAPGSVEVWNVPLITGTYFTKALDTSGN